MPEFESYSSHELSQPQLHDLLDSVVLATTSPYSTEHDAVTAIDIVTPEDAREGRFPYLMVADKSLHDPKSFLTVQYREMNLGSSDTNDRDIFYTFHRDNLGKLSMRVADIFTDSTRTDVRHMETLYAYGKELALREATTDDYQFLKQLLTIDPNSTMQARNVQLHEFTRNMSEARWQYMAEFANASRKSFWKRVLGTAKPVTAQEVMIEEALKMNKDFDKKHRRH